MKQKIFVALLLILFKFVASGQSGIESINGFKYAYVNILLYENNNVDIYGITEYAKNELTKKGMIVLDNDQRNWPQEAKLNPCLIGQWFLSHSPGSIPNSAKGGYVVKNCLNEIVYENYSLASHFGYYFDKNSPLSVEKSFKPIRSLKYKFDEDLTPKIKFPTVETSDETEETIKKYLTSNKIDPIEGIYKSYQNDLLSYYKLGIIKQGDKFKAIILESDLKQWKAGEVKAIFESSSLKGLYSTKWYTANKTPYETFGKIDDNALLTVEGKNQRTGEKILDKFIKMFPAGETNIVSRGDNSKASGSGFFISTSGIIATNAHVIEKANRIEIIVITESGASTYNAKPLMTDRNNDVALIQVSDENFKMLQDMPYSLTEKVDIGEKVFTIGYPLNDIMGTNYKVTDGIISSKSGIADDIRYYQISVPLQPGNSGGPLFNKDGNIVGITSAKLNSDAVGTAVENVNYAIKISYLLTLYNMLPNSVAIQTPSNLVGKEMQEQIKTLKNFVCLIKVY
jgi:S1-C subfamily serine protease